MRPGTLKSRLASARRRLRHRLIRRGVAPATAAMAAGLAASSARAAVPASLAALTVDAAVRCLMGRAAAAGAGSASVSVLTEGVLTTMFLSKLRTIGAILLAAGTCAAGLGVLAQTQSQTQTQTGTRYDEPIRQLEQQLQSLKLARESELRHKERQDQAASRLEKLDARIERDVVTINLVATKVTDDDLKYLRAFPNLLTLYLHHTEIGDAGVANLQPLKNLTTLDLFDTRVTDAGLAHLAEWMPFLQWVDLNATRVTDAGLEHLKGLKHLRRLDVRKTGVTEAGAADLRRALPARRSSDEPASRPGPPAVARKSRLASQEADEARRESQGPVSAEDADAEPDRAEGIFHLASGNQPLAVSFSIPAEQLADPSERRDASRQDVVVGILFALDEHGPVRALHETATGTAPGHSSRLGDIEEQDSSRHECLVNAAEEPIDRRHGMPSSKR